MAVNDDGKSWAAVGTATAGWTAFSTRDPELHSHTNLAAASQVLRNQYEVVSSLGIRSLTPRSLELSAAPAALALKTPTAGLVSKSSFAIGSFCNRFERESLQWAPEPTGMLPCGQLRPPCQRQVRLHHHRHHQLLRSLPEVQPLRHRLLRKPSTVTE